MSRGRTSTIAAVLACLAVAGCGGGDPKAFGRAADQACRRVDTAVSALRTDLVRTRGTSETVAVRRAITRYAGRLDAAARDLQRADPPGDERAFRDDALAAVRRHATVARRAAGGGAVAARTLAAGGGDDAKALGDLPGTLARDAPACSD